LDTLDGPTRALVRLAAAIAGGQEPAIEEAGQECVTGAVPPLWVDELLLQGLLMVGWPRTLNAARVWRRIAGPPSPGEDGSDYARAARWRERGEAVCEVVYGRKYPALREYIHGLNPNLDAWMVTEGYGRTLARPGLDLARRELCVIAQVAVQGARPQLHSHLRGALNAGATRRVVADTIALLLPMLGPGEAEIAADTWARISP
jgi:4-carboxymuconolactone decarboxylase